MGFRKDDKESLETMLTLGGGKKGEREKGFGRKEKKKKRGYLGLSRVLGGPKGKRRKKRALDLDLKKKKAANPKDEKN